MPNVDSCVRACEAALCDDIDSNAQKIAELPDSIRVTTFRRKNTQQIKTILENCKKAVQSYLQQTFYDSHTDASTLVLTKGSDNNRDGADVYHKLPDGRTVEIEVKFGLMTDRNIGNAAFDAIFGTNVFSTALSVATRKVWIARFLENADEPEQYDRLATTLNTAAAAFNTFNSGKASVLSAAEQQVLETLILDVSGDGNKKGDFYVRFTIDGESMRDIKKVPTGIGSWDIEPVTLIDTDTKRINVFVKNKTTGVKIQFTLNWKNNYKIAAGRPKVAAKLGFGSSSWNVWVTPGPVTT